MEHTPLDLIVAPATLAHGSVSVVWDKPRDYAQVMGYSVYCDGEAIARTAASKTHYTVEGLTERTCYHFSVTSLLVGGGESAHTDALTVTTCARGEIIDVTMAPYCADASGAVLCTDALQRAIDDCPMGGTVYIPAGATILSGALELKSDMNLRVDGMLVGSLNPADYTADAAYRGSVNADGLILTRYEGWEMHCYRSLVNAGYLNPDDRAAINCKNIRICGSGTIRGGGNALGTAMKLLYQDKEKYPLYVSDGMGGRRARGRLIGLIQCRNVHLTGITIENPPCWTVHMIYCDTVTTHGVSIHSRGIDNGDGWDPDSSKNMMIFDTVFDTGDDCIAIKSGKNPDGNRVNIPTENVRIFDLNMLGGNGMAIGSEQSGGIDGVYMRDCVIQHTNYGLELKAHNDRGGYIKNVHMRECKIDCFLAHSVRYNSDGEPAKDLPVFSDIQIDDTVICGKQRAVELIGFAREDGQRSPIRDVRLTNVTLDGEIHLDTCEGIAFSGVRDLGGGALKLYADEETVADCTVQ